MKPQHERQQHRPQKTPPSSLLALSLAMALCTAGCRRQDEAPSASKEQEPPPSNRIDVPDAVRKNLGITFAPVERRQVAATLRLPAQIELLPHGRLELRTSLPGRVRPLVTPLQTVTAGTPLVAIESPMWRQRQQELADVANELAGVDIELAAMPALQRSCEQHEQSLKAAASAQDELLRTLATSQQQVGGQASRLAETKAAAAATAAQLAEAAEKHTETNTRLLLLESRQRALRQNLELALLAAADVAGRPIAELRGAGDGPPPWQQWHVLETRAPWAGIVESVAIASGALVEAGTPMLCLIDPTAVVCQAQALQGDLMRLRDGLPTHIVQDGAAPVAAELRLGLVGDPTRRTLPLFARPAQPTTTLRPGTTAWLEITTAGTAEPTLAIPRRAVLQDGLQRVFFRRDPKNPDKVIRVEADLGVDDGAFVEVKSGLVDGDQVVTDGAYELVLASGGQSLKGGHYHADGTWHEDH